MQAIKRHILISAVALAGSAHAALYVEVSGGQQGGKPIAIAPIQWEGKAPRVDVAKTIEFDLKLTGMFAPVKKQDMPTSVTTPDSFERGDWQKTGAESLIAGAGRRNDSGQYEIDVALIDVFNSSVKTYKGRGINRSARKLAHALADKMYEKLTGHQGAFSTAIAYVTMQGSAGSRTFTLNTADIDGGNERKIFSGNEPIMSPSWSPNGRYITYVTFEGTRSALYRYDTKTRRRQMLLSRRGTNGAPSWSPDGRKLAITLSEGDNLDIYIYDFASGDTRRLTDHPAIDTEASWSPDGSEIVFTSDRGGRPQIYRIPASGGRAERLTFAGKENHTASYSPDGTKLVMVNSDRGRYRIALYDLERRTSRIISRGRLDESPSFAPNGRLVIYSDHERRRGRLAFVSLDNPSAKPTIVRARSKDVREPSWSPYIKR